MTSYANHRRGATSSVKSINLVTVSSTSGSDVRCAMYDSLTDKQISLLNVFHADDGRTEADVFLVFEARANSYAGKVCIETDTPPKLIIERITGIDKRNKSNFFLPINIVDDEEWRETIPKFETWCYGVARYPQVSSDGKSICPELKQESCKQVSELDKFELFSSALVSTLSEYFSTGEEKYAENTWKLVRYIELNFIKKNIYNDLSLDSQAHAAKQEELYAKIGTFEALISVRDQSSADAVAYKQFIDLLSPFDYYWLLYQIMAANPELVHKSYLMNLDTFLFGLLTQTSSVEYGCSLDGIDDSLLRMILERAMVRIPKLNLSEFIEENKLVEYLHRTAGKTVENSLKYWAFMTESFRLVNGVYIRKESFQQQLNLIRTEVKGLTGIIPACLLICPSSSRYLSDRNIAEYIYASSKADRKFAILSTNILVSNSSCPNLQQILKDNTDRIRNVKKMLKSPNSIVGDPWTTFLENVSCIGNPDSIHNHNRGKVFKEWLIKYSQTGSEESLQILINLVDGAQHMKAQALGYRRCRALILRSTKQETSVFKHFSNGLREDDITIILNNFPKGNKYQCLRDSVVESKHLHSFEQSNFTDTPIEFVHFELARKKIKQIIESIQSALALIPFECYICFVGKVPVPLHGEMRHAVCTSCVVQLDKCPICRVEL